ncbi:MAG: OmpA family protein [Scytonema sp. PMC 1069.18]|nr:OmpA family protein [Scytonema sp. PMC 1069.18]MEC4885514.1 OmpA family protein [Scytonema sp. PMC 1070.18]
MSNNYFQREKSKNISNSDRRQSSDELSELRRLLFGVEKTELDKLYERLNNPRITAEDVSGILPDATKLRSLQDHTLGDAMVTTVEHAIQASVKKDENVLATAIFPIVGPATRKAVTSALQEMMQSLDRTLEYSVSPKSVRWRLEARQTGKTFAEIVLLRTLIYRVEQVFLIHKKNGLLLQHIVAPLVTIQDPDLVAAMLTAIQDFVRDSFHTQNKDGLQSLQFGDLVIWIEEGPQAVLASIIRGTAPQELRLVFQEAIEKIHQKFNQELISFEGETEPLAGSKTDLESCLRSQQKSKQKSNYTYALVFLSLIASTIGLWSFFSIRERIRWNTYLKKLDSQPGIIVVKAEQQYGKYFISGMRDPLAVDPNELLQQTNLNPEEIRSQWENFISLEPQLISKRATQLLKAPKTVSFKVDANGILHASGSAPHEWIVKARKLWNFIPGIIKYQDNNLIDNTLSLIETYKKQIEQERLFFFEGTTELLPEEEKKIQGLQIKIKKMLYATKSVGMKVQIQILGHTDNSGTDNRNIILSQNRANKILSYLSSQGIDISSLSAIGVSSSQPLRLELSEKERKYNRGVSFEVVLTDSYK